ncbi:hypothetical protein CC80DRAFT_107893 [Byssothecium circinans]|uniref:Stc1 domain-containing protein n=1 Tax=Byssothecium circinans TaxID=147558 RepID=A0A6A5UEM1_9PLEO|nr:hypothetical protein CC80DRAFT_107893 [Byssothecium circinans]
MPRKQAHFYDPVTIKSLQNVPLPPKIKCGRCTKWLGHPQYSTKQLTDARFAIMNHGHNARFSINCTPCTGNGQPVEIECSYCGKTKGLEEFAKSQRRKPDSAKCYKCTDEQLDQDAVRQEVYESDDRTKRFEPGQNATGYTIASVWGDTTASDVSVNGDWDGQDKEDDAGGITLSKDFQSKLSMSSSKHETLIETEYDLGSNDGWQSVRAQSWRTPSQTTPSASSRFDPGKYGRPAPRSASGSAHTFSSGCAERSDAGDEGVKYKNGWAKIKAYDPRKNKDGDAIPSAEPSQADDGEWSSSSSEGDYDSDDDTEI